MKIKNKRVLIVVFSLMLGAAHVSSAPIGDVNDNGSVDIVDALITAQYYVGSNPANFHIEYSDVNCSGSTDIVDALFIARYYVGLITEFPCTATPEVTPIATTAPTTGPLSFITRSGSKLYEGSREYRFVSVNIPNYFILEDRAGNVTEGWHRVTEFEQKDACRTVKLMGGQLFRTYTISIIGGTNVRNNLAHITGSNGNLVYNEDLFKDMDRGIAIAKEEGLRMYIPLIDNWQWFGGCDEFAALCGGGDFWTSVTIKTKFKEFITWLVNRTNTVSGIKYKDEPAIMGWELGNEIDKANDTWIAEIAAHIKSQDPNHLVIDGGHKTIPAGALNSAHIDVLTTHYTDGDIQTNTQRAAGANKAYIYGEFRTDGPVQSIVDTTISAGSTGCLIWSLRFRTEYGGFYFHSDFDGSSDSLQYPGFTETMPSNEREIFSIIKSGAARIQGKTAANDPVPIAPVLKAITNTREINWQGSAGALSYIVQRASSAAGPWTAAGTNVSDAKKNGDTAALPLFSESPGTGTWYYRVIAVNNAGQSPASNIESITQ